MESQPLAAGDQIKVLAFIAMCILSCWIFLFFGGFIPVLILLYGYIMMRVQRDFDQVRVTVKYAKLYMRCLMGLALLTTAFLATIAYLSYPTFAEIMWNFTYEENSSVLNSAIPLTLAAMFYAFLAAIERLYFRPLQQHGEWVALNGAFATRPKKQREPKDAADSVNIVQRESLEPFSVADELAKWAKLRDDGVVSEAEFEQARAKLLNK